jgi:predicted dehydrogenase
MIGEVKMSEKIKIGIVGTGGIAHAHMEHYVKFADVEIVGACDIAPGKAREFLDRYNLKSAPAFESVKELVKNVKMDGASVCTYNTTHAVCAVVLLEAGIHVLCEKPMSFTIQEAADMVKASKKAKKILTIGFQPRFDFMRRKVDRIIESGAIGKVYYVQSAPDSIILSTFLRMKSNLGWNPIVRIFLAFFEAFTMSAAS